MTRAYCREGDHFPGEVLIYPYDPATGEAMDLAVVCGPDGKSLGRWEDGIVGVPADVAELVEDEDSAYCAEHTTTVEWRHDPMDKAHVTARLEYLRQELRAERMSYGELAELQSLAEHIEPGDVELLEAAGVPEAERETPYYTEGLAAECGYDDEDLDGSVDDLIGYKDALEGLVNTIEAKLRGEGVTLAEWLERDR